MGFWRRLFVDRFVVEGGVPLHGMVETSGAKNSALPVLAACLLTSDPVELHRIPAVKDIRTMMDLMVHMGASVVDSGDDTVTVSAGGAIEPEAPYEVVKTMRASSLVLGPLVGRFGRARVSLPGGCAIGARPIDLHMRGLEQLGAKIEQTHGYIEATAPGGLRGATVHFDRITVTGTEDILMAAVLAQGETLIENAAREPEVVDLADLLSKMGAEIAGAGTSTIRVRGVKELKGVRHTIIADRIEAGTFAIAAAITGGDVSITRCVPDHLTALNAKLRQAGAEVTVTGPESLHIQSDGKLHSVDMVTEEHPGFPTDLQAQYMSLMTQADGIAIVSERIFENRFMHAPELARMGASIRIDGRQAIVAGPRRLTGAHVMASDLRASASLVLAGLVAEGETIVDRVYHMDRGYAKIESKLAGLGARIRRVRG
ncbi:MAG TPA: UDP-N-acetylglucosamine 1-carboxyvinyltransferase [Bryobacteraceae bacterium]|nr:UDP-N-acetylglucosamine 1-carboxyvinyltransferase [Bryobacteraceae bacterium]